VKRLYGVKLNNTVFLATLVDLPCIIEAMKTLDYFNFYKSQDASQMLFVHKKRIENWDRLKPEDVQKITNDFNCLKDDEEFFASLYERREIIKKMNDPHYPEEKFWNEALRFRHGISPIAKNIRNIRYKKKPQFDIGQVKRIETILKDLIDFGFADHVDEQLLEFDEEGNLTRVIDGKNDRKGGNILGLMGNNQDNDDIIKDDYGSASSSGMGDDGGSSIYEASKYKSAVGNKSVMKSEFTSDIGGGRPDESNFQESASISNFRHDLGHSAQKPS
jgi:TATA-binding protein-associated factor Taf7